MTQRFQLSWRGRFQAYVLIISAAYSKIEMERVTVMTNMFPPDLLLLSAETLHVHVFTMCSVVPTRLKEQRYVLGDKLVAVTPTVK